MRPASKGDRSRTEVAAERQRSAQNLFPAKSSDVHTPESVPSTPASTRLAGRDWLAAGALVAVTFIAFIPALKCDFVNFDDEGYVTTNAHVLAGLKPDEIRWALTTVSEANWHPLTWLSLQLDASLWKKSDGSPNPFGFHLTNVLFHVATAAILFLSLRSLTGAFWRSIAVSLLFAVHPLRVESVVWVAERKDVLSAFFGILALLAYSRYVQAPSIRSYLVMAVPFGLSLLAKPMFVTLPALLLVLDWWPLARWPATRAWPLVREKLPLIALTVASCVVTVIAQAAHGAVMSSEAVAPLARLENAVITYSIYLANTAWPMNLAVFYPHMGITDIGVNASEAIASGILLIAMSVGAIYLRRGAPYLLAGWLWYLGTLIPVIGIVQVGGQARADRYTYFPQIGILIAVVWGTAALLRSRPRIALAAAAIAGLLLTAVTWRQQSYWVDSKTLWEHDLEVAGPSPVSLNNYGAALYALKENDRAMSLFRACLNLDPNRKDALRNLGIMLQNQGKLDDALPLFERLCEVDPKSTEARLRSGEIAAELRKYDLSIRRYQDALDLDPELVTVHCDLGRVELLRNELDAAEGHYRAALAKKRDLSSAHNGLGSVLIRRGKIADGIAELEEAIRCNPRSAQAHNNLGDALERTGKIELAAAEYEKASQLNPGIAQIWFNIARTRAVQRRFDDAVQYFEKSLALDPRSRDRQLALTMALNELATTRAAAGRFDEASAIARRARDQALAVGLPDLARNLEGRLNHYERREVAP
jgi:tetratricopeptide (TPR) repeat protein